MLNIQQLKADGYELVYHASNPDINFDSIIAVHSTALGPALGGCRVMSYENQDLALTDVLRLAEGMSLKNSIAGLNLGGGKAVIDLKGGPKTKEILEEFGEFVNFLGGKYLTAEDVGSTVADMEIVRTKTPYVASLNGAGDPSPVTAYGVFRAIEATVMQLTSLHSLKDVKVAIQGLGKVGYDLAIRLHAEGAELYVSDVNPAAVAQIESLEGVTIVDNDKIHAVSCDIFAPCALGMVITKEKLPELQCLAICGAANNQLMNPSIGKLLMETNILYAPDYVVNGGGVISIAGEIGAKYDRNVVLKQVDQIYDRLLQIYKVTKETNTPTNLVADNLARERINAVKGS